MNTPASTSLRPRPDVAPVARFALIGTLLLPLLLAPGLTAGCSGSEAPPAKGRSAASPPHASPPAPDAAIPGAPTCRNNAAAKPVPLPRGARLHRKRSLPGGITLRIHRADYGDVVTLRRNRRLLFAAKGYRFRVASEARGSKTIPLVGRDINGDGHPEVVLREWSGGAHCCYSFRVLRLGACVSTIATLEGSHGGQFEDLDGDGVLEFMAPDPAIHHWGHYYVWQSAPQIVWAWRPARDKQPAGYHVSAKHMLRPAPSKATLARWRRTLQRGRRGDANCCRSVWMFEDLLRLLYTGHEGLAWRYLDRTWPKRAYPRKGAVAARMKRILSRSVAYQAFRAGVHRGRGAVAKGRPRPGDRP